ncbi:MAG: hypothetical protein GXO66_08785 [Euryarchaeota archaeon]|nr:hypothetical protein [Euryarchaeota archaeon]
MRRAQITLEAILIISFFVLILVAVSIPMGFRTSDAGRDVGQVVEMRTNLEKLSAAVSTALAQGPGAVQTVRITSNSRLWVLATADPEGNASLSYWTVWESRARVPAELAYTNTYDTTRHFGGLGRNISGIRHGDHRYLYINSSGKGTFVVRVENRNLNGGDAEINFNRNGSTITIILAE